MRSTFCAGRLTLLAVLLSSCALAANFSFTGNFTQDDNVQLFNFSVGASSPNVILRTWSYAGGTNAAGALIPRGGFDPILALFDSTGALIGQNDDGGSGAVAADSVTGLFYDTYLAVGSLAAGNYTVAVMQYDNFAIGPNLVNGFTREGQGNFTGGTAFRASCANSVSFCDAGGNQRLNHWAFDILNVESASTVPRIPEPGTYLLMAAGLGLLGYLRRR